MSKLCITPPITSTLLALLPSIAARRGDLSDENTLNQLAAVETGNFNHPALDLALSNVMDSITGGQHFLQGVILSA